MASLIAGTLGLTGSAALDPSRLDTLHTNASGDVDVIVYPDSDLDMLQTAVQNAGGQFPADLADGDPRFTAYLRSRLMPPTTDESSRMVFWRRRRDLVWIGPLRLDLTFSDLNASVAPRLAYAHPPAGSWLATVTVVAVNDHQYPVTLDVEHPSVAQIWITARGYQTVLRPGDRLAVRGLLHRPADRPEFASVDDAAEHQITLLMPGESS